MHGVCVCVCVAFWLMRLMIWIWMSICRQGFPPNQRLMFDGVARKDPSYPSSPTSVHSHYQIEDWHYDLFDCCVEPCLCAYPAALFLSRVTLELNETFHRELVPMIFRWFVCIQFQYFCFHLWYMLGGSVRT